MGKIQIVAGTTPHAQKVADQLAEAIQQKYGQSAPTPSKKPTPTKHQEPEHEAGD